jgi:hypothetical protein
VNIINRLVCTVEICHVFCDLRTRLLNNYEDKLYASLGSTEIFDLLLWNKISFLFCFLVEKNIC